MFGSSIFAGGAKGWVVAVAGGATLIGGTVSVIAFTQSGSPPTKPRVAHHLTMPPTDGSLPPAPTAPPAATPAPATPAPAPAAGGGAPVRAQLASVAVKPAPVHKTGAPSSHVNFLTSDDATLNTSVGLYSDCTGNLPLQAESAALATCVSGRLYFLGHNYGVFTPLIHMGVGAGITYWDGYAVAHHFRVVNVRPSWLASNGPPPPTQSNIAAQFQTCATPDGAVDRILDAVSDGPAAAPAPAPAPVTASVPSQPVAVASSPPSTSALSPVTQPVAAASTVLTSPLYALLGRH